MTNTPSTAAAQTIPDGFLPIDLGAGYSAAFGPVYRHHTEPQLAFRVSRQHLNPSGACHGGALCTFADVLIAVIENDSASGFTPTITLSLDFIGAAREHDWVVGTASLTRRTRTMLFVQALLTVGPDVVARAHGIYRHYAR
jgi:uncharacterized protein (TIGR00369 family)